MNYYKNTTQVPNKVFNNCMKLLSESELKVLLTVIHRTIGQVDPQNPSKRIIRAWVSQRLFCLITGLSNKSVSNAINTLVSKNLIRVSNKRNQTLSTKALRRGASRLYYESCLQLSSNTQKASEQSLHKPVNNLHTIKLNTIKEYSDYSTQGMKHLKDAERFKVLKKINK